VAWK
jgi:hypothetical protein